MGIALDPAFEDGRPFVYLMATRDDEVRVLRYRWNEERTALTGDGITLDGIQAGAIHDSGRIRFGPDDRLYVVTGDPDRRKFAQERSSLNGNVLSLAPSQYRQSSGEPRIVSIGHATRRVWTGNRAAAGCGDEVVAGPGPVGKADERAAGRHDRVLPELFRWLGAPAPAAPSVRSSSANHATFRISAFACRNGRVELLIVAP